MSVKKTISLSKNSLIALFKALGEILEEDSELADKLRSELMKRIILSGEEPPELEGLFEASVPNDEIRSKLVQKSLPELIAIVNKYALDPAQNIRKTKDREKIITFILEKRTVLIDRYKGF